MNKRDNKNAEGALMRILANSTRPYTAKTLATMLNTYLLTDYDDISIREIVKKLRDQGQPIVAYGTSGYKLTYDPDELLEQAKSLRDRGQCMVNTANILFKKSEQMRNRGN